MIISMITFYFKVALKMLTVHSNCYSPLITQSRKKSTSYGLQKL